MDSSSPRYLWWSTASKYSTRDFEHETLRMVTFFALNDICYVSAQCTSVFRSCCSDSASLQSLNTTYKTALSANSQFALLRFRWYRYRLALQLIVRMAGFRREDAINAPEEGGEGTSPSSLLARINSPFSSSNCCHAGFVASSYSSASTAIAQERDRRARKEGREFPPSSFLARLNSQQLPRNFHAG